MYGDPAAAAQADVWYIAETVTWMVVTLLVIRLGYFLADLWRGVGLAGALAARVRAGVRGTADVRQRPEAR